MKKGLTDKIAGPMDQQKQEPISKAWREDIRQAVDVLNRGGVILYPTDTIWGIGCDATNQEAVQRVYEIKRRIDSKALITLVDTEAKLQFYVRDVPNAAWDIIDYATRPTTIVYDTVRNLAPNLSAEDGSVGIRITQEPFSRELCARFRRAIVSTSANVSGEPSAICFDEISDEIKEAVDYICTSRRNERKPTSASAIIKLSFDGTVQIIRQ